MDRLVAIAVNRRYLMVGLLTVVLIGGLIAFKQLNIEAYPDPTPPMVDVVTQSPGLSSEEIERYITIPIETQVAGIKNLRTIRTISLYGLSDVKLQFSFDYTYDEALQQVLNRLSQMAPLPGNVQPGISPLSAIGEIYRYRLVGPPNYSVLDLKTLQDWVLQRLEVEHAVVRRALQPVAVDFADRAGRRNPGLHIAGQRRQLRQPVQHLLQRFVIGVVERELQLDVGQSVQRNRADRVQVLDAGNLGFDRDGDVAFDFLRRQAG